MNHVRQNTGTPRTVSAEQSMVRGSQETTPPESQAAAAGTPFHKTCKESRGKPTSVRDQRKTCCSTHTRPGAGRTRKKRCRDPINSLSHMQNHPTAGHRQNPLTAWPHLGRLWYSSETERTGHTGTVTRTQVRLGAGRNSCTNALARSVEEGKAGTSHTHETSKRRTARTM